MKITCKNLIISVVILFSYFNQASLAFEPLTTPDRDTMILYDDEENTEDEIKLGKQLFFDKRLSINFSQSCASCHMPSKGFSDGVSKGKGAKNNPLGRNSPHLYNLAWSSVLMWDGREETLESQALGPIRSEHEMMLPIATLLKRLEQVPAYKKQFVSVYATDNIVEEEIGRSLAAFQRTIIVDNTPFDKYLAGDTQAMTKSAVRGLELFQTKGNCVACHDGANFTDDSFHSLGFSDNDAGRGAISGDKTQYGAFKTPGLRNIEFSSPYMHGGSLASLEMVIDYYNRGGGGAKHTSSIISPLALSGEEKTDLVNFLLSLSQPLNIKAPSIP